MKKALYSVLLLAAVAVSYLFYTEYEKTKKHSSIIACEEAVKAALRTPDTYKFKTAKMEVFDSEPHTITIDFRYTNPFAVETRGVAICTFTAGNQDTAVDDYLVKQGKWKPTAIKEQVSPFAKYDLNELSIDGIKIDPDLVLPHTLWLISNRRESKVDYLPGKIIGHDRPRHFIYEKGIFLYEDKPLWEVIYEKYLK